MDYAGLRLKYHGNPEKLDEVLQAECRDKCSRKLPTLTSNPDFRFPSTALAEMSTSEAVADIHASLVEPGERVLDMTFGLGVDAFAMSGIGALVTGIDLDERACLEAVHNAKILGFKNIDLIHDDSIRWLAESDRQFDIIFIDPQRRDSAGRHFVLSQCLPDIPASLDMLLRHCRRLIIKMSPMIDIKAVKAELGVKQCKTLIIGTAKECKEVVMILSGGETSADSTECITIGQQSLKFDEQSAEIPASYLDPYPGWLLLEPYPSVMKGASIGSLRHIGAPKIAPNTHLFLSETEEKAAGLPCERMVIHDVIPFNKATVRGFAAKYPSINVAVRNFPLSAPELAHKLKVREGGDKMVHGITLNGGSKVLIITGMPY